MPEPPEGDGWVYERKLDGLRCIAVRAGGHFGALLAGYYDSDGRLRYAGKVGTGFGAPTLADLHRRMTAAPRASSPFADRVREKCAHWTEPQLVANIAFTEWTDDGKLRHPRYEGLRPDKKAREVVREAGSQGT